MRVAWLLPFVLAHAVAHRSQVLAEGSTKQIADVNTPVTGPPFTFCIDEQDGKRITRHADRWSKQILHLVNDPLRTDGWHSIFSGHPNDSVEFDYAVKTQHDVYRLIKLFSHISDARPRIVLSLGVGPRSMAGRIRPPVLFHIGNQGLIDAWFHSQPPDDVGVRRRGRSPLKAAPPTLTLYVDHSLIDLTKLEIPKHIDVRMNNRDRGRKANSTTRMIIEDYLNTRSEDAAAESGNLSIDD